MKIEIPKENHKGSNVYSSLREEAFTIKPASFRIDLDACPSCAETISQAIAEEVRGIKQRLAEKQCLNPDPA